jgi:murein DD-endopeptidase MepM/ murein hydrolase activator NlpD
LPPPAQSEARRAPALAAPHRDIPQPAPAVVPTPAPGGKGEAIEVQSGDTLYGLSKKHKVSISELMAVNELKSPSLKPGQKLHLPVGKRVAGTGPQRPLARVEAPAAAAGRAAPSQPALAAGAGVDWQGSYTIKPGDSLYAIARQHKIQLAELQSANGITDARRVKPGTVIKIPGATAEPAASLTPPPAAASGVAAASRAEASANAAGQQPMIINAPAEGEKRVAALGDAASVAAAAPVAAEPPPQARPAALAAAAPAAAPAMAAGVKMRWPVKGKVIAGFGPRPDGTHNDGVNLSVPMGSDVHAAEAGTVAYAGSELKGYGNLILIRHDNDMVTAYAHNDQLLVKRGDKVKRGQVVAKAGKTGTVDQPQVHFELRQGAKPIDPMPYMEKL